MEDSKTLLGRLYIVGTPIGNLRDMSQRGLSILKATPVIAAEDTRRIKKLLSHFQIAGKRLIAHHQNNEKDSCAGIIQLLQGGQDVAQVSDAGMPLVSDPGSALVCEAIAAGIEVEVIPGPSAVISALLGSGLCEGAFAFLGFPPRTESQRSAFFAAHKLLPMTLVYFEAPGRVCASLEVMAAIFGPQRKATLARELTKIHEEYVRGTVEELLAKLAERELLGECCLVVEGHHGDPHEGQGDIEDDIRAMLDEGLGPKDISVRLALRTGKPKRQIYQLALSLKRD